LRLTLVAYTPPYAPFTIAASCDEEQKGQRRTRKEPLALQLVFHRSGSGNGVAGIQPSAWLLGPGGGAS